MKKSFRNLTVIFFLGISSGLPLALILSTLKAFLLEKGFDLKTIGFFSLISIPYSIKFLFAPIIDSCTVPFLTKKIGQRKSWIVIAQLLLVTFIALLGFAGIFTNVFYIATFAILIAFASASQDIVIDAYRIELFKKEDQGLAAGLYVYGYRLGMLISGALALVLAEIISWDAVYFFMAAIMALNVLIVFFAKETRENWRSKNHDFISWIKDSVVAPFVDFTKHNHWFLILIFVVLFKLGDAFAGSLTLPFLLEIGFTKIEIAAIVKTFGLFATLGGVLVGGLLVKKLNIIHALWIAGIAQMLSNFAFSYLAQIGHEITPLYFVIFTENFSGGIGDAVFVAYLSVLCNIAFSATQYAILVSLATIARTFLSASAGIIAQNFGWYDFFIISAFLALPGLILLFFITHRKTHS